MISDGFTVEGKGKPVFTIPKKLAPKLLLNTNYTIPAVSRSDRRRVHFVPISQFYGVLNDSQGKTPADVHGGYLLEEGPLGEALGNESGIESMARYYFTSVPLFRKSSVIRRPPYEDFP